MPFEDHRRGTYAYSQRRWFESLKNYEPKGDFRRIIDEAVPRGWLIGRKSIWTVVSPPGEELAFQGWKIHVSARSRCASEVLSICTPLLCEKRLHFKVAADFWILGEMNGKGWPRESASKFITVYPNDTAEFISIGNQLARALTEYAGPYILSDRRWPGSKCVFYRYGGFRERGELALDGSYVLKIEDPGGNLVEDDRKPYFQVPPWVVDPLTEGSAVASEGGRTLKQDHYEVLSAVRFSNRGGIYRARDHHTDRDVMIKEARSLVEIGRGRSEATEILRREYQLLQMLRDTGYFVRPIEFFTEWEHVYLVEEFLTGVTLADHILGHNPIYLGSVDGPAVQQYIESMSLIWLEVAAAIKVAHERGIVIGDLSATNIMIGDKGDVTLIDLEGARSDGDDSTGLFTPGFARPSAWETGESTRAGDLYSLGSIILASLALVNSFADYYPPGRNNFLKELTADLDLPGEIVRAVDILLVEKNLDSLSIDLVIDLLESVRVCVLAKRTWTPRLTIPADERLSRNDLGEVLQAVRRVKESAADYLLNVAEASRRDRLFPADMRVFSTNPFSVSYGACGVIHALWYAGYEIPKHILDWVVGSPNIGDGCPPGLYVGTAGIAWVLDEMGLHARGRSLLAQASRSPLLWEGADILYGAAGFGLASLRFWMKRRDEHALLDAERVGRWLLKSASQTAEGIHWNAPNEYYVGYARGGSGIALFLLYLSLATGDEEFRIAGRRALAADLSHAAWNGTRFRGFPEMAQGGPSPYWLAGTAGIVAAAVRYQAAVPDEELDGAIRDYRSDLCHKYAKFPQLFAGLAGMGNTLLDIWHLQGDDSCLRNAWQIAEGILLHVVTRAEGTTFPGARGLRESADFATGTAGVLAFLSRLLAAETAEKAAADSFNFNFTLDELLLRRRTGG